MGGLRDQYEQVRGKVGELENIGNLGAQLSFEQRETLIYFEEIVKGDTSMGGFWGESEEESSYEEQKKTKKSSRTRHDSDSRDRNARDHNNNNSKSERSRPQVARYRLMNDDEEFEASPNEYRMVLHILTRRRARKKSLFPLFFLAAETSSEIKFWSTGKPV